jgi:hypothetical protein
MLARFAALVLLLLSASPAYADESVGLWIKNTAPFPVTVNVDGAQACALEAPTYRECNYTVDKKKRDKIIKLTEKRQCTTNNLKISCITNVRAAGANVTLRRGDGLEYKLRAAKGGTLYLCIEPTALTDCFGKKLQ